MTIRDIVIKLITDKKIAKSLEKASLLNNIIY